MARECVFCGRPANSVEDALPLWLANLLEPKDGSRAYHRMEGAYWEAPVFRSRVKRVCATVCNNGWMSRLEGRSKPLLEPMIFGVPTTVATDAEKRDLASWALKTAMMLELAKPGNVSRIPTEHFHLLYAHQQPPPQTKIWIAAVPKQKPGDHSVTLWQRSTYRIGRFDDRQELYFVAFFIGELVFQIFGRLESSVDLNLVPSDETRMAQTIVPVWPVQKDAITWPPPLRHTERSLNNFLDA